MDVMLKLPDALVKRAQEAGILTDEQIADLIEAELDRRQRQSTLFADIEKLRNLETRLTPDEIEAELLSFRQERAAKRALDS